MSGVRDRRIRDNQWILEIDLWWLHWLLLIRLTMNGRDILGLKIDLRLLLMLTRLKMGGGRDILGFKGVQIFGEFRQVSDRESGCLGANSIVIQHY